MRAAIVVPRTAYDSLCRARRFAVGAAWMTPDLSLGATFLRSVLADADADPLDACVRLAREGTPEGRMYGLCGIRLLDPKSYEACLPMALRGEPVVEMQEGCLICSRPAASVADRIRRGEFDADLSALMPMPRR